jgi:hypothetical protein
MTVPKKQRKSPKDEGRQRNDSIRGKSDEPNINESTKATKLTPAIYPVTGAIYVYYHGNS